MKSGTPKIDLKGLTTKKILTYMSGEDIRSKTATEDFKNTKFSLDQSPPKKEVDK